VTGSRGARKGRDGGRMREHEECRKNERNEEREGESAHGEGESERERERGQEGDQVETEGRKGTMCNDIQIKYPPHCAAYGKPTRLP